MAARPAGLCSTSAHRATPRGARRRLAAACRAASPAVLRTLEDSPGVPLVEAAQPEGERERGCCVAQGCLVVDADADRVFDFLTDYNETARVFRNIDSGEVLGLDEASGHTLLLQRCRWKFLLFSGNFDVRITVEEDGESRVLTCRLAEEGFMRHFEGRWAVTPLRQGRCYVEHRLAVRLLIAPPPPFGQYTQRIFDRQVTDVLCDLTGEVCRWNGAEPLFAEE